MSIPSVPDYNPSNYPPFAVTVDVVLFTIEKDALQVLLIRRGEPPYKGHWALPGGFVKDKEGKEESLDQAAARELWEETELVAADYHLEQLKSYGDPGRDPRMRVVTVAYWAVCEDIPKPKAGSDAALAEWVDLDRLTKEKIAFDHHQILVDARERLSAKMEYTAIAAKFLPKEFTVSDLRRVYELVWSTSLDAGNFQRSFRESGAFQRLSAPSITRSKRGRPASLWSLQETNDLSISTLQRPIARRVTKRNKKLDI